MTQAPFSPLSERLTALSLVRQRLAIKNDVFEKAAVLRMHRTYDAYLQLHNNDAEMLVASLIQVAAELARMVGQAMDVDEQAVLDEVQSKLAGPR